MPAKKESRFNPRRKNIQEIKLLHYPPIMEDQMEKKMENEMETGGI